MARSVKKIAKLLGANVVAEVPETGGGAFGAARLSRIVQSLQDRLSPSRGKRPGRPTDSRWVVHPKMPISTATAERLARLAERASTPERHVSPMQVAVQLLEEAVAEFSER
jgi:hypothetical protein